MWSRFSQSISSFFSRFQRMPELFFRLLPETFNAPPIDQMHHPALLLTIVAIDIIIALVKARTSRDIH